MSKVDYLRSILVPTGPPSSIPDDSTRRHIVRQETVTHNFRVGGNQSGAFVLFPNNPTALVGVHFTRGDDPADTSYRFDDVVTVAQELADSYNYSRKTSGLITIKSSTLPSGVYALSGTMNAATYEGSPSEVGLPDYEKTLQITSNEMDKIGNVSVGEGITVLMLPVSFSNNYTRLMDKSPSVLSDTRIFGSADSLVYSSRMDTNTSFPAFPKSGTFNTKIISSFNCDSTNFTQVEVVFRYTLSLGAAKDTPSVGQGAIAKLKAEFIGLAGNVITSKSQEFFNEKDHPATATVLNGEDVTKHFVYPSVFDDWKKRQPLGAIRFSVETYSDPDGRVSDAFVQALVATATSHSASSPGVTFPVTIVTYEGVAAGATMTLSGVANYELVPNPELARNLRTLYSPIDPDAMDYVKRVMAARQRLQIRTVWNTPDYYNRARLFDEMSDRDYKVVEADAFGIGDILRFIKRAAVPVADAIIPGAGQVLDQVGSFLGVESAGGVPIAASGVPITTNMYGMPGRVGLAASGTPMMRKLARTYRY